MRSAAVLFPRLLHRSQPAGQGRAHCARAWHGAALGALAALMVILLSSAYGMFGKAGPLRLLMGTVFLVGSFALAGTLLTLLWRILRAIPMFYVWVLACTLPALALMALTAMSVSTGVVVVGLGFILAASLPGASIAVLRTTGWRAANRLQRCCMGAGLLVGLAGLGGIAWLLDDGYPRAVPMKAALPAAPIEPLSVPNPSQRGSFPVRSLFYGSGTDRQRAEYGPEVDLVTQPVNGAALVEGWSRLRTAYWGFGPEALPLNARVWYPEGQGPFPLVLVVHGQHPMEDFSDPGYAYLGELLASRGFIVASVDENFLNLSPLADLLVVQPLKGENDLRGWLLLEHLRAWKAWNASPGSPFYQTVDMDNIALMGHSRGGEAVAIAAVFNSLPCAPEDARMQFDYHFQIRSIVGIAPVDGATLPAGQEIVLENINYLVLHGAHDMDVFTFQGQRQYERARFTGVGDGFKAALYIAGANHGQFNTVWGRKDLFEPVMRVYHLEQLMPAQAQQQVAAAAIGAFLEATLHGQTAYRAFFQNPRRGVGWLPDARYLHQYADARTQMVSTFEEDIHLTTTTLAGGVISGENLAFWREQPAQAKWQTFENQIVLLGWDLEATAAAARYTIRLPGTGLVTNEDSMLVFSIADAREASAPEWKAEDAAGAREPVDLTIEVVDRMGNAASLPLRDFAAVQPQIQAWLGKAAFFSPFPAGEMVLQHVEIPLEAFAAANPAFDARAIAEIHFRFDRTRAGRIVLDAIGVRTEEP